MLRYGRMGYNPDGELEMGKLDGEGMDVFPDENTVWTPVVPYCQYGFARGRIMAMYAGDFIELNDAQVKKVLLDLQHTREMLEAWNANH